jgi:hypothetical protein
MSLDPGFVRVVDLAPISESLLAAVSNLQRQNLGRAETDPSWIQLACSYETADGDAMDLAVPASDVAAGDVIDVEAVPVVGVRFNDDVMQPPVQLTFARALQLTEAGWRAEA